MKFSLKTILTLLGVSAAVSMSAQEVVKASFCEPTTFLFGCQQFTSTGVYPGIDVGGTTKTLDLRIGAPSASTVDATIKKGETFLFGCDTYTVADTYQQVLTNVTGCDSVVTLNLKVVEDEEPIIIPAEAAINASDAFLFGCRILTEAGDYYDTLQNYLGKDSIVKLTLTVNTCVPNETNIEANLQLGKTYLFGCQEITPDALGDFVYTETFTNIAGCDSVVNLTLHVIDTECKATNGQVEATLKDGETFLYGCQTYTAAGTYTDTLVNAAGCDSIVTIVITAAESEITPVEATIEANGAFLFGCRVLTEAGDYYDTLTNYLGQDSIVKLTLNFNSCVSAPTNIEANLQLGKTYLFGCQEITPDALGDFVYTETLTNIAGCDSVVNLTLHVIDTECKATNGQVEATLKDGETFLYGCQTYTAAGTYTDTLVNAAGCDSIVTIVITAAESEITPVEATIEANGAFLFGCRVLTEAGDYYDTLTNYLGQDSIVKLTLNFNSCVSAPTNIEANLQLGKTYLFGCQEITPDALGDFVYTETLTNIAGCDSVVNLTLHVIDTECKATNGQVEVALKAGETFLYGCQTYTAAGTYTDTLVNAAGCDSIVTIVITAAEPEITPVEATIEANGAFLFGCRILEESGTYYDSLQNYLGGDSIVKLTLTVNTKCKKETTINAVIEQGQTFLFGCRTLTVANTYIDTLVAANGCDSIVTLNLTHDCTTRSNVTVDYTLGTTFLYGCQTFKFDNAADVAEQAVTLQNAAGCDSIVTLTFNVAGPCVVVGPTINASVEVGQTYLFGCKQIPLTAEGTTQHEEHYTLANGCDSVVYLSLTATPKIVEDNCPAFPAVIANQPMAQVGKLLKVADMQAELDAYFTTWNSNPAHQKVNAVNIQMIDENNQPQAIPALPLDTSYTGKTIELRLTLDSDGDCVLTPKTLYLIVADIDEQVEDKVGEACEGTGITSRNGQTYYINSDPTLWNDTAYVNYDNSVEFYASIYRYSYTMLQPATVTLNEEVCYGSTFSFPGDNTEYAPQTDPYTITLDGAAANGCDSIITLYVTEAARITAVVNDTVCPGNDLIYNGNTYPASSSDYTVTLTATNGCDSIVTLHVYEYNATLPIANASDMHAVCGEKFDVATLIANAEAAIAADPLFVPVVAGSVRVEMKQANGTWTDMSGLTISADMLGSTITVRVAATTTKCGDADGKIYSAQVDVDIETPTAELKPAYDDIPARTQYGEWLLMVNVRYIQETLNLPEPADAEVQWYRMTGTTRNPNVDTKVGTGRYYTEDRQLAAGQYYAIITLAPSVETPCGAVLRTVIVTVAGAASAPELMPNKVQKGEQMNLINIDPSVETNIMVYDAQGKMVERMSSIGESTVLLKAASQAGMYLVKVENETQKNVLRYIVVK